MIGTIVRAVAGEIVAPLAGAVRWLLADGRRIAATALLGAVLAAGWHVHRIDADRDAWRGAAGKWQAVAGQWETALAVTRDNLQLAAKEADRLQAENLKRVADQRRGIDERAIRELEIRTADLDRRAGILRAAVTAARADPGGPGGADVPAIADATCRAFDAAGCDGLSAKLIAAQRNTDQLVALQQWVAAQADVATSLVEMSGDP